MTTQFGNAALFHVEREPHQDMFMFVEAASPPRVAQQFSVVPFNIDIANRATDRRRAFVGVGYENGMDESFVRAERLRNRIGFGMLNER
ncbi:MAG: hypothetical protein FI709_12415 [SAR202 cluster bacterium]|jgi:hypothetical protein|nr:hypothetical protein [SAR202 cluster bacterium]MDP6663461.1 hypothetical protein [SAR202 cluster bacterium]MDP6798951.1 hypothetical protein [SAR202 cluster bacterium]MQG58707.1 hypothetical protein [SAR202 cluster bacterium]|tara:strand:+ start:2254 stop:2520 length:267 start_codon:yes stop_codon:yes gene_type:complete